MKKFICLLLALNLLTFTGFSSTPPVEKVVKFTNTNQNTVTVTTDFAGAIILDAEQLKTLEGKKIHHIDLVYTQYKSSPSFNQQALNERRKKDLLRQLPQINKDQPSWRSVEQTGATTRDEAADYFHGFVIHYSDDLDYQSMNNFMEPYQKKFTVYNVNNANGGEFSYDSGSKFTVAAQAVRYADGSPVTGTYQLSYREFRDQAEIAFSGIPMTYNEQGELMNFNSAGMYELRAEQNGKELALQKPIVVDFNCTDQIERLDFYALDDVKGEWVKKNKIEFQNETVVREPQVANVDFAPNTNEQAWSTFRINDANESETEKLNWSMHEEGDNFIVTFDEAAWKKMEDSQKKDTAGLHLIASKDAKAMTITSALEDKELLSSAVRRWEAIFEMIAEQPVRSQGNTQFNAALLAQGVDAGHIYPTIVMGLNSPSFGVYNCDQVYRIKNKSVLSPVYVDKKSGKEIGGGKVACLIDLDYNGSFSFQPNNITCNPKGRNSVLLFTNDNGIYLLSETEFKEGVSTNKSRPVFEMTNMTASLKSPADLKKVLHLWWGTSFKPEFDY